MYILSSIIPVFAIMLLGFSLRKTGFMNDENIAGLNKLTYWVGLPALLFYKISTATYSGGQAIKIYLLMLAVMLIIIFIAYLVGWRLKLSAASTGAFVQAAFRGNLAFIGLPIIIYSSALLPEAEQLKVATLAVLTLALMVPTFNFAAVLVLLLRRQKLKFNQLKNAAFQIITNPLLLASIAGLLCSILKVNIPPAVSRTTNSLGQMSLPLALLAIGGSLISVGIKGNISSAIIATLLKIVAAPLTGFFLAKALGFSGIETKIALIYLSTPTAIASYVMASQLDADKSLAANTVIISTLLSVVSLSLAVAL